MGEIKEGFSGTNASGKPRRSEAEGTNSVAVGVGLTNQLGHFALGMKKTPPKMLPISPDILSPIDPTVHQVLGR